MATRREKLASLFRSEGCCNAESREELLESAVFDGTCPGVCMSDGCEYTTDVEPDQDKGWCEECCKGTVSSALILAGLI